MNVACLDVSELQLLSAKLAISIKAGNGYKTFDSTRSSKPDIQEAKVGIYSNLLGVRL